MLETFSLILLVLAILGFTMVYLFATKYENRIEQQLRAQSLSIGATYWKGSATESELKSILLNEELATYVRHMIRFNDGTRLGQARFMSAKDNDSTILFDFASVPIKKYSDLWLVIDSRKNNILGRSLMDTVDISKLLKLITLEGNFPDTYKVYIDTDNQIDALTALNPASMEQLLQIFVTYDMEIYKSRIYLYKIGTQAFYSPDVREKMVDDIKLLATILT